MHRITTWTPALLPILGMGVVATACGSSAAPSKEPVAPVQQPSSMPTAPSVELHLEWLDANRLRVSDSAILNVNTGLLFLNGTKDAHESPMGLTSSCDGAVAVSSCMEDAPRSFPTMGPGGRRAWIDAKENPVESEICVWLPRVYECPDYNPEELSCYRVVEGIREAGKEPEPVPEPTAATDSLSIALRGHDVVYLRHRGLEHGDGASACYEWRVDRGRHLERLTLLRSEETDGVTSIPERSIALWGEVYQWDWRIAYRYDDVDYDKEPEPAGEHDGRDECPDPNAEERLLGGVLGCIFPIGEFVEDSLDHVKLGRMSIFKTHKACEASLRSKVAFRVPSCGAGDD